MKDIKLAALVALLAAVPAGAAAQNKSPRDPIVQVGLFGYRADGLIGSAAYDTWPDLTSTVYVSLARCGMGAGNRTPPEDAQRHLAVRRKGAQRNGRGGRRSAILAPGQRSLAARSTAMSRRRS